MLPIQKTGPMDGIGLYFHVYFSKSHTPLGFSTDPWSPRTNWLQTILFFDQSIVVNEGSLYYGGIEFTSPTKVVNLNDMVVNLEMLLGDPKQADLEVDMSWHFKLTPAAAACQKNPSEENQNILKFNKNRIEQTILKKGDQTICPQSKGRAKTAATGLSSIACSGLLVTTDNCNSTIIIGKHNYPLHKSRKTKCKYPKTV